MATYKNPLQLSQALQRPEPPEINNGFYSNAYKDGYKLKGNEARLGKGRINYLIEEYGLWNPNSDYSKAYLGFIDPREFIKGTITDNDTITKEELANPLDLDLEKINNNTQTPFLTVDFDNKRIKGHEGRHRLSSFIKAGINRLPIVFRDYSPSFRKDHAQSKNYDGIIGGQDFADGDIAKDIKLKSELIPINYKNIVDLYRLFGSED